jgi:hypothetical protein
MSAKVDQFCDRLRDRLNAIEGWLESVKADIRSLPWKARKGLRNKMQEAQAKLQAQKERVEQTRAELKARQQQAAGFLVDSVIGWKPPPKARDTVVDPHRSEAHIADAIDHAVASIDEVRDTALYAAAARLQDAAK